MSDFDNFVAGALDEGYILAPDGLPVLYDLLNHLSEGGTIHSSELNPSKAVLLLAVGWYSVSRLVEEAYRDE